MPADHPATDPTTTLPPAAVALTLPPGSGIQIPDHLSVPGYVIIEELGRGGMGVVYKARQTGLNRDVALKMVLSGGHASATDLARFKSEAEAVAKLHHPNVVQIYEVGEAGGLPYFSLEYCAGGSLEKLLGGVPQPPKQAAEMIETLARAVHAAHEAGIIHRDLKPANILLQKSLTAEDAEERGEQPGLSLRSSASSAVKISDFGLAKQIDSGSGRTASGAILGTPSYMAPEQANGSKEIGPPADTYALGAILYELLTGRPPFRAATPLDTVLQVVGTEPVPPTRLNPQVPRDLETIALKCLQKDPAKRYASAAALADDLRCWQADEPIAARPAGMFEKGIKWAKRRPAIVGLLAAVVLAIAIGFAGVLYELRIANEARARAETQEGLANQRADELDKQHLQVRRELHQSDLLRADLLLQGKDFARGEQLLWRSHLTRPDDDDQRAYWQLWELYHQRPRRSGAWIGAQGIAGLSLDGRRVAAEREGGITIYDSATGAVRADLKTPQPHLAGVFLNRDGSQVGFVSMADGSVAIWDVDPKPTLRATLSPAVPFRPDAMMALGGALADVPQEQLDQTQRMMFFSQTRLCFVGADRVLLTGPDKAVLWNLDGPVVLAKTDLERVSGFLASVGGRITLPVTSMGDTIPVLCNGEAQLWELPRTAGGSIVRTRLDFADPARFRRLPMASRKASAPGPFGLMEQVGPNELMGQVLLSSDGKWLITHNEHRLRVWDVASGAKLGDVEDGESGIAAPRYAATPDGTAVRAIYGEGIRFRRLPKLDLMRTIKLLDAHAYLRDGLSPDGKQTIVIEDKCLAVYDHQPTEAIRSLLPPNFHEQLPTHKDVAPTGPVIGSGFDGLYAWSDDRTGKIATYSSFSGSKSALIAANGTVAVSVEAGIFSANATVYDLATRRATATIALRDPERGSARLLSSGSAVSPDGRTLAVANFNSLMFVDLAAKKVARTMRGRTFSGVLFTPDSRAALYRIMPDNMLVLAKVADGQEMAHARVPASELPLAFSPDGKLLLTRGERRLILRNAATLAEVGEMPMTADFVGAGGFRTDGRLFAAGSADGKLHLWDVQRREELVAIDLASGPISKVVFTPDGAKVRFVAEKQVGELDLHAYDPYVEDNRKWNLLRLLPELNGPEAERVLERLRESHPDAYRAGIAALNAAKPATP